MSVPTASLDSDASTMTVSQKKQLFLQKMVDAAVVHTSVSAHAYPKVLITTDAYRFRPHPSMMLMQSPMRLWTRIPLI